MGAPPATRPARPIPSRPTVGRVTDRAGFVALRRRGVRSQHAGITVTYVPPAADRPSGVPAERPRVAFAVGRAAGTAVARNRIRRRLRAAMAALAGRGTLPGGTYLVGGGRELADRPWPALVADVEIAVARARARADR